jgi:N utilization substance protein A
MSREIVEAIRGLEQEKGIDAETLMAALEDALLSAYKKTPGAAKYARVDLDRDTADFRVFELILPPELEEKLMAQAIEGQRSFTGTLTAADERRVRLDAPAGEVEIPLSRIRRSNLIPEYSTPLEESR